MKKVALFSFIFFTAFIPQVLFAGGGPTIQIDTPSATDAESVVDVPAPIQAIEQEQAMEEHDAVVTPHKRAVVRFHFFLEKGRSGNRHTAQAVGILIFVAAAIIGLTLSFFAYKYYRKNQEINQMLGIRADGSDLDETTKSE